jgi:sulfatase maturation enzyme AslB (radical SAM superfamily)
LPFLTREYHLHFTGGEPLLSFALIQKIVGWTEARNRDFGKKAHYSLTTNGSLISSAVLSFLARHRFAVTLSFDGTAQDIHRQPGSRGLVLSRLTALRDEPRVRLKVNGVFTPATVHCLSDSLRLLLDLEVPDISFTMSVIRPWGRASLLDLSSEMRKAGRHILGHFRRTGRAAVDGFRDSGRKGIFTCAAGKDRMAVAPDGRIWGCHLFSDYFRGREGSPEGQRYCFGTVAEFQKHPEETCLSLAPHYERLAMDNFATSRGDCFLCREVERCTVCPVNAAFSGSPLGRIPLYMCRIRKIIMEEEKRFHRLIRGAAREYPHPGEGGPG